MQNVHFEAKFKSSVTKWKSLRGYVRVEKSNKIN